ncbi:MAG: hypothetical protein II350_07085, partial [Clostridia bacterium]|nr:hypothetical protein [Clostridia bacterium]
MKQSATLPLREPKARFTGRSPASFLMRVSALHFQNKKALHTKCFFVLKRCLPLRASVMFFFLLNLRVFDLKILDLFGIVFASRI